MIHKNCRTENLTLKNGDTELAENTEISQKTVSNLDNEQLPTQNSNSDLTEEEETELLLETREEEKSELGTEKPVTIMFASIKGFEVPPDSDMDVIEEITVKKNKLDSEFDSIVSKYGGVVDKIIRNTYMANFGTKVSHKNVPAYAVLAALELVDVVQSFDGTVHVGINSGLAWIGGIGTERSDGVGFTDITVIGDTVNLAARLKNKTEDNQILVSPKTYQLTKEIFEYEVLSPVSLKGISEPVTVYVVKGKTSDSEIIATVKENAEERLKRLQKNIPPYLKERVLAEKSRIQGERKPVTMLYSDVSGFTAMSEKFRDNPSKIAEVMDLCHKALGKIIYKYEGRIDQIVGDELMAIFGAPITHEDDPERAIQAGLEMLQEIKRFSEDMKKKMGMPSLNVHIGVNTGRVSIGQISDDAMRMDYTVIGEPVELAEKLEDISVAGQIVVGERTYRLTRALFDFRRLSPVEVGGRKETIYEVVGVKDKPSLKRGDERLNKLAPIGRDEEYRILKKLSENLIDSSEGHFVCMIGEAGLGKSRLKRELKAELLAYDFGGRNWLEGTCFAHTENTAYSVFQVVIKSHLNIKDTDSDEVIRSKLVQEMNEMCETKEEADEIIPFIGNMLSVRFEGEVGDKVRFLEFDPEKLQLRTFVAIRDWLIAESRRNPVVLALEDLHWIDEVSRDLIVFLMDYLTDYPILILCLFRPERLDRCWLIRNAVEEKIPDKHTKIELNKLSPQLNRQLLNLLIELKERDENQEPSLKDIILEKSDGNPFYMEEIIRNLMDDKVIVPQNLNDESNRTWILAKDIVDIKVPDSIDQVMNARIDRLNDEPKLVLRQSSTIGRAFEYDILKGMSTDEVKHVNENLSKLVSTDMISVLSDNPLEYQFSHIVTHTITYRSIPLTIRRKYHNRVGLTIEDLHRTHLERFYERLAQQFRDSNNDKKAAIYLTKAGTKARKQFSNSDAINFYSQALKKLEKLSVEDKPLTLLDEKIECHEGLGDIYSLTGEYDLAIENFNYGLQIADSGKLRTRLKRKIASVYYNRAEFDTALEFYNKAQEEIEDKTDSVELARIYNGMAEIYGNIRAEWSKAFGMNQKAMDLIGESENYDVIAVTYKNMGTYQARLGRLDIAVEYFQKALELATQIGDKLLMSQLHNNLGVVDRLNALSHYEESIAIKEQMGYIDGLAKTYLNIGVIYSRKQELSKALEYFNKTLKIAEKTKAAKLISDVHSYIAGAYSRTQDYQKALEHYQKSLKISQEVGDQVEIPVRYANICDVYIKINKIDKAMEWLNKAISSAEEAKVVRTIAITYSHLGRIYHAKGQYNKSLEEFKKAMRIAKDANATIETAEIYRYFGEMLVDKGNIEEAKVNLNHALKSYKKLGQQKYVEEIEEILLGLSIDN